MDQGGLYGWGIEGLYSMVNLDTSFIKPWIRSSLSALIPATLSISNMLLLPAPYPAAKVFCIDETKPQD
ncbi:MAG: hypothetical protein LBC51_06735 [Treponema sp.]|nr:hypothetical protein [Treponema sp.]